MKNIKSIKNILDKRKDEIRKKFKIIDIGIFGSYVRDEQNKESDIDILVEFGETPSLFEFIELEDYLSQILGVKVDLVMKNALKPTIGKQILKEVIYV